MKKTGFLIRVSLLLSLSALLFGCDMFSKEIPPEELPPIPQECIPLSTEYTNAITGAYSTAKVSQMQITRVTNEFLECMQNAGLSRAEAVGIVKNREKIIKEGLKKDSGQGPYVF
jgi:hypothetical protein